MRLPRLLIAGILVTALFVTAARLGAQDTPPRFENVVSVRVTRTAPATCVGEDGKTHRCVEAFVVIVFRQRSGTNASVSTSYKLDGSLPQAIGKDFGPASSVALRSFEASVQVAALDGDPQAKEAAAKLLPKVSESRRYEVNSEVVLPFVVEQKVNELANEYHRLTRKRITVTSGTRTPASQAEAMYTKLDLGDDILKLYRNQAAAKAIKKAYDDGKAAGKAKADVVAEMATVIENQVKEKVFISNHLRAGAVDVRTKDMTDEEKKAFESAVTSVKGMTMGDEETKPPHFHLDVDVGQP